MPKSLIVITGPTAVGKTDLCLSIARHYDVPVINADSRQIYRELKIGTAAPTAEQQLSVRHYFVGHKSVHDYYNASMYETDALQLISRQHSDSDVALLSGGSMMYIDAVCKGLDDIPTVREDIRTSLRQRLSTEGLAVLLDELRQADPDYYATVDRQNYRRVIHALEICQQTGRPYSTFLTATGKERPFRIIKIGLNIDRDLLYERINRRVDAMMAQGLADEARSLLPLRHLNALATVGYKELFCHFDGMWTLDEAVERIKGNTRRYARKQLTWYKRDADIRWFAPNDIQAIINHINLCLQES